MCGIAGILLSPSAAAPRRLAAVAAMTATLHHRGPDGSGIWMDRDAGVAFGHRRLAIVDLSEAGHQPMLSHGEGLVATYNGEIYNSAGLRLELESLGHRFRGHSDTEIMLAAFEAFGVEAALQRFAGMFALGLWDRTNRVLHLARDSLGKKPLYVALVEGALVFASELRALRAFPGFQPKVDTEAVALLLRHGWVPDDHCIYEGVFKLPPGTMLSVRAEDLAASSPEQLRARVRPWWSLAEIASAGQQHPLARTAPELEAELDSLLRLAVRERMVADVPLGAFLSGGIDSSIVVALMQEQSSRPVRTFTIGFDEARYDEAEEAARIARHLGTEHTEFRITAADARAVIPELPRIWDEPFADESQIPTLLVSRLARRHVTVALSGDGGDECFGGYARHFLSARMAPAFRVPAGLRGIAASALQMLGPDAWDGLLRAVRVPAASRRGLGGDQLQKLARVLGAVDERELYERLTALGQHPLALRPAVAAADAAPPLSEVAARFMYRDMAGYLPGDILVKLDRASMAVGLEARCPLLDRRVVEFAWRVPTAFKIREGKGKWLLRRVLGRYLPEDLFERPKHGFNVPVGAWLRGPLRDWAEELLAAPRLRREGFLDPVQVQACWREHLGGRRDRACELWAVLMLQAWLDGAHDEDLAVPAAGMVEAAAAAAGPSVVQMSDWGVHG
jgi:asparagine synthase (glutamine-hydrolysing)